MKRTNKEWKRVSEYLIKYRKTLKLNHIPGISRRLQADSFVIDCCYLFDDKVDAMYKSLSEMQFLEQIHIWSVSRVMDQRDSDIITRNAETLRVIVLDIAHMPADLTVTYPKLKKIFCNGFDASNAGQRFPKLQELSIGYGEVTNVSDPGSRMPNLKKFTSQRGYPDTVTGQFVMMHSAILVSMRCTSLYFVNQRIEFSKLTDLQTRHLPVVNVSFPVLEKLDAGFFTSNSLSRLPLIQLKEFTVWLHQVTITSEATAVYNMVSQMQNLTHLTIYKLNMGVYEDSADLFPDLFANMHKLQSVTITRNGHFGDFSLIPSDMLQKWLSSLIKNNAMLKQLHMDIAVSNATLILCSKLKNLQTAKFTGHGFSMTGVKALLTGSSRNIIREIELTVDSEDVDQVEQEIRAMEWERDIIFKHAKNSVFRLSYLTLYRLRLWLL
jgi:hypothetical protein